MIAVISDVHFPSNAERQKIMETGLKKLTGIRALFICGDFTDNRKDTKPEEEMKLPEYIKKLPYPVFFIDGNHEDYDVLKRLPKISDSENELLFQKSGCSLTYWEDCILMKNGSSHVRKLTKLLISDCCNWLWISNDTRICDHTS